MQRCKAFHCCVSPQALQSHIKSCAQCFILAAPYMDLFDLLGILNNNNNKNLWSGALICVFGFLIRVCSLTKSCWCTHLHIMSKSSLRVFCQTCFFGRVLFISRALGCQVHLSLHIILKRHCYGHLDLSATSDDCHHDKTKVWFILMFFPFMFSCTNVAAKKKKSDLQSCDSVTSCDSLCFDWALLIHSDFIHKLNPNLKLWDLQWS